MQSITSALQAKGSSLIADAQYLFKCSRCKEWLIKDDEEQMPDMQCYRLHNENRLANKEELCKFKRPTILMPIYWVPFPLNSKLVNTRGEPFTQLFLDPEQHFIKWYIFIGIVS